MALSVTNIGGFGQRLVPFLLLLLLLLLLLAVAGSSAIHCTLCANAVPYNM